MLYWFSRVVKRNKKLYAFSLKLWKVFCRFSKIWWYENKNYLGRTYIVRRIPYGSAWYLLEDYGIKWGVEYIA